VSGYEIPDRQDSLNAFARTFLMSDFAEPNGHTRAKRDQDPGSSSASGYIPSDEEVLEAARNARNAAKFASLYDDGDISAYDHDDSRADLGLVSMLAFYTQDPDQLDRLFRSSALDRRKWHRRDYRDRTIKVVLDSLHDRYSWETRRRSEDRSEADSPNSLDVEEGVSNELISRFKTAKQATEEVPEAEVPWTVRPFAAEGSITEIAGKIKASGKTTFVCRMVESFLDGEPFMGQPTQRTGAVFLTEQTPTSFREAMADANLSEREDLHILYWHDMARFGWPEIAAAAAKCKAEDAGVLIVDTLSRVAGLKGEDENNSGKALEVMAHLKTAAAKGLTVIYTRHDRKSGGAVGESGRGSSAFGGDADLLILLKQPEGNQRPTVRTLETLGRFRDTPDRLMIELMDWGYKSLGDTGAFVEQEALAAIVETLPATADHAFTADKIIDNLAERGIKRSAVYAGLNTLKEAENIACEGKRGDPRRYYKPTEGAAQAKKDSFETQSPRDKRINESDLRGG
jgi:AAA domain-containing protein/primase/DNA polymerase family protein